MMERVFWILCAICRVYSTEQRHCCDLDTSSYVSIRSVFTNACSFQNLTLLKHSRDGGGGGDLLFYVPHFCYEPVMTEKV